MISIDFTSSSALLLDSEKAISFFFEMRERGTNPFEFRIVRNDKVWRFIAVPTSELELFFAEEEISFLGEHLSVCWGFPNITISRSRNGVRAAGDSCVSIVPYRFRPIYGDISESVLVSEWDNCLSLIPKLNTYRLSIPSLKEEEK